MLDKLKTELNQALTVAQELEQKRRDEMFFAKGGQVAIQEILASVAQLETDSLKESSSQQGLPFNED